MFGIGFSNLVKYLTSAVGTGSLRMSSGYNSETLPIPGAARQYLLAPRPGFNVSMNAGWQYLMALRPGFGGFDRVSKLHPEDILKTVCCGVDLVEEFI